MINANPISIFTFSIRYLSDPNGIFLIYGNKSLFLYIWTTDEQMLELYLQVWSPSGLLHSCSGAQLLVIELLLNSAKEFTNT